MKSMVQPNTANTPNPWDLLRHGDTEKGLTMIKEAFIRRSNASHTMEMGIAYLWTQQYSSAFAHFNDAIHGYPRSLSRFFGMAGTAQWCMDQPAAAVDTWQAGLKAEYTDAAGLGVRLPLLLFAASILKPEVSLRDEAEATLREKAKDLRAGHWPGVLTRFVLGRVSAEEALGSVSVTETFGREHVLWWVRFYGHLLELDSGILTKAEFAALMRILTDTSQPSFSDLDYFLTVLWTEEFFIARHSARSD